MLESLVVNILNRFLKDYVSNLNYDQLKIGIWKGEVNLSNLKLRKDALDKLDLPVSVSEGYLGQITLVIPWSNLKSEPVKVIIDHIYLLAEPKNEATFSVEEEEERLYKLKQQRLETAELLDSSRKDQKEDTNDGGFLAQLTNKVINNLQFEIKNIHIRYEDKLSDPGHPFAIGLTLNELSGLSTDDNWQPKFISDPSSPVYKLVTLESLAVYWNTDAKSLAGMHHEEAAEVFTDLIPTFTKPIKEHQYLLKPVSGTGKVTLDKTCGAPKTDVTLLFDEIAFGLDDHQYRDCILMLDLFQANIKKQKYLKFHPGKEKSAKTHPRDFFQFAAHAILSEIHERNYKWTWDHFRTRRDQRIQYVECYMANKLNEATEEQAMALKNLERVLSFQDIRFYRSIANVKLRKQKVQIEIENQKKKAENAKNSWWGWATGASKSTASDDDESIHITEEQKKELFEVIEYDEEKINASATSNLPNDAIQLSLKTKLNRGSFVLKKNVKKVTEQELFLLVFDSVSADFTQYVGSMKVGAALGDLQLFDGSSRNTIYRQIIGVKTESNGSSSLLDSKHNQDRKALASASTKEPFFSVVFEKKPLKSSASNAVSLKMRPLEIIYSPVLIESVTEFFKPPSSKMEGVNAVIAAAENKFQQLKLHSRAGLEFAFENHTTFEVDIGIDAPIIYVPESLTNENSPVLMINAGHIKIDSELADANMVKDITSKEVQAYNAEDVKNLERLMYDKFNLQLTQTKIIIAANVQECLLQLTNDDASVDGIDPRFIDHMDMKLSLELCILPGNTEFTKVKVSGYLPLLSINMSDYKYRMLMGIIESATPPKPNDVSIEKPHSTVLRSRPSEQDLVLPDTVSEISASSDETAVSEVEQFKLAFVIDKVSIALNETCNANKSSKKDQLLCEVVLERFEVSILTRPLDLSVDLSLKALHVTDKMEHGSEFGYLLTSDVFEDGVTSSNKELLNVKYQKAAKDHPHFSDVYDECDQTADLVLSTFTVVVTRSSLLHLQDWATNAFISPAKSESVTETAQDAPQEQIKQSGTSKTKVTVHMDSANVMLNNDGARLATLGLSSGDLSVMLEPKTLEVCGKFGNLTLSDDAAIAASPDISEKWIVSIVGDELADFSYKTYNPEESQFPGYNQAFKLRMGSIQFVVSNTLQPIMNFMTEFLEMKSVYDAAKTTAKETAKQYQQDGNRFHFDVLIESPLVVLPAVGQDTVTAHLGEIRAKNEFFEKQDTKAPLAHIECGVYKINLQSTTVSKSVKQTLPIIKDLDIAFIIDNLEKRPDGLVDVPSSQIRGSISDVLMSLTEKQYRTLLQVSDNLQKTFNSSSNKKEGHIKQAGKLESSSEIIVNSRDSSHDIQIQNAQKTKFVNLDLAIQLSTICLEILKDAEPKDQVSHSLSKLAFNAVAVKMQTMSDESMKLVAKMQSIQFSDTRVESKSKFRDILPAKSLDGPQFQINLCSYKEQQIPITDIQAAIDSPKIILSLDYLFLLKDFFTSPFVESTKSQNVIQSHDKNKEQLQVLEKQPEEKSSAVLRVNASVTNFEIVCLASPEDESSEAIVLSFNQLKIEQQEALSLGLNDIELVLCRMNNRAESTLHFIEPFDISLLVNNPASHSTMTVNLHVKPIILRLSYQDVMLIATIANKGMALIGNKNEAPKSVSATTPDNSKSTVSPSPEQVSTKEASKESLIASFEGLQIILIEDLHNLPFIDFYMDPFQITASEWSRAIKANVDFSMAIKSFNFKNSHWEPLLEPWSFDIKVNQGIVDKSTHVVLDSKDFIYLNVTHTFIESALAISQTLSEIKSLSESAQVQVKPYLLVNSTGYDLHFWSMSEDDADVGHTSVRKLSNGQSMPWSFSDWKSSRESIQVSKDLLGVQLEDGEIRWDSVQHIAVDREGESAYLLRPEDKGVLHRLMIDVRLENHVKKVTFRSGLVLENNSSKSMELAIVDDKRRILSEAIKLRPQETYSVPIKMCFDHWVLIRPSDQYEWSKQMLTWSDVLLPSFPKFIECSPFNNSSSGSHLFQTRVEFDKSALLSKNYPHMKIQFCAPIEIENLLPFDFDICLTEMGSNKQVSICLQKGTKSHVHEFSSNSVLNVQLDLKSEKYKPSEVSTIKTTPQYNSLNEKLVIRDQQGIPTNLRMHVSRTVNSVGSLYIGVYAPYMIINKSGLPIHLRSQQTYLKGKTSTESIPAFDEGQQIVPTIFSYADISTRNRSQLSMDAVKWSEPVSFEAVGNSQDATLLSKSDPFAKHVGIKVEEGKGNVRLTKIVTITPRYVLKNNMTIGLDICEYGTEGLVDLKPGQKTPFYQTSQSQVRWICLRFQEPRSKWSSPFNIQDIGKMYVKIEREGRQELVRVSVSIKDSTIFVALNEDDEWPYRIINDSSVDIQFTQTDIKFEGNNLNSSQKKALSKPQSFMISSGEKIKYSWDIPVAKEKKLELCVGDRRRTINFEAVGSQVPFRYAKRREGNDTLSMDIVARGSALVLHITDFDLSKSLYRPKSSSKEEAFETVDVKHKINSILEVNLAGLRLSIIDRNSQELALATIKRFEFKHTDSNLYQSIRLGIEWIQIDNQLFGSTYPILCYPSARPKVSNEQTTHPTLHVALDKAKDNQHGVQYFKIFSFLLQEMAFEVDETFLYALMDFAQFESSSGAQKQRDNVFIMETAEPGVEKASALYYFEEFCIQPMRLNLSFVRDDKMDGNVQGGLRNTPVGYVFNVLTMTIGNVNDAPIKLNALMVDNLRASSDDLASRIALHYREQAMYQVHRVLGSIDILGNPVGLFNNLSSGFGELFYEPYQGFIMSDRPQDLGIGVAKGVGGFMKKSVFGVTDSLSRLTGSLGKGLSAATMDKKFQDKRRTNMVRNKPTHAINGVTQGVGYFGSSLASGITGLVTSPMEGASKDGAVGFVGGLGKGLVGAITKPVAGLFDMTSNITAGIRETASDETVITRERLPRFIGRDGILKPYSEREALGQLWLKEMEDGSFLNDAYVAHGVLENKQTAVILTYENIIVVRSDHLKMETCYPLDSIQWVEARSDGVHLQTKKNANCTFIFDQETNSGWFAGKIKEIIAQRREEDERK
ncbi:hypothetical protein G6F43_003196 [Rhizopus delemar]|nr:hypothetical protein G6F43_003196 [Rhizopus delemar]